MTYDPRDRFLEFGPFIFDTTAQTVTMNGVPLPFERRHFVILKCLIGSTTGVVRCIDPGLSDLLSSQPSISEKHNLLTKYISEMRIMMEDADAREFIETVTKPRDPQGVGGYQFTGIVKSTPDAAAIGLSEGRQEGDDLPSSIMLTRAGLDRAIGAVEERLEGIAKEVWISGNDNMHIAQSLGGFVTKALRKGRKIKLLGVDPDSAAAGMLALIDPRFEKNNFREQVNIVTEVARDWQREFPHFEYKLLPILPAVGYFITDPELPSQTVKIELYTARPWDPLGSRPHLVITESMGGWPEYFIQQFKNYWEMSNSPFD
jgi:DNA-binding winged helix-turn-helix (wHTH) protein